MKVFVAGGTGVVGRPLLHRLVAEGHDVRALARSPQKADLVRRAGATPVEADLFDPEAMRRALEGVDAALHAATSIPPTRRALRRSAWAAHDRLRREGTRVLVDAALRAGIERVVKESIAFVYPDGGDAWIDEDTPPHDSPMLSSTFAAEREVERFSAAGGTGVTVRLGMFYGPEATTTDDALRVARMRLAFPVMGRPEQYHPSIHTDDAAAALAASLRAPAGLYNAAGTPSTKREFADAFAEAFGLRRLRIVPRWLAVVSTGGRMAYALSSQRVSSARFTEATGWRPDHPGIREGWAAVAAARAERAGA
jgi:nucleoside-diphosphate-sugar epimerase